MTTLYLVNVPSIEVSDVRDASSLVRLDLLLTRVKETICHVEEARRVSQIPAEHPHHRAYVSLGSDLRAVSDSLESMLRDVSVDGEQLSLPGTRS